MYDKINELISKTVEQIMIVFENSVDDDICHYSPIFDYKDKRLDIKITKCNEENYSINIFVDYNNCSFVYITYLDDIKRDMVDIEKKIEVHLSRIGLR